jgi:hypothetical protein
VQKVEAGIPAPGLPVFGQPGRGVWADESPGDGKAELEVSEALFEAAAAFQHLPTTLATIREQIAATRADLREQAATLVEVVGLQREQSKVTRALTYVTGAAVSGPEVG